MLAAARSLAHLDNARVKLYRFSDRRDDQLPWGDLTDRNIESRVADFMKEAAIRRHFGLYLSTPRGEAVDVWDGFQRAFERRVTPGLNPFILPVGAEIVFMTSSAGYVKVYCRIRAAGTEAIGRKLLSELTEILGDQTAIEVIWADSPWFFGELVLPPFLPVLGWAGPPPNLVRPPQFRCRLKPAGHVVSCSGALER
jgi:hypothetical protein